MVTKRWCNSSLPKMKYSARTSLESAHRFFRICLSTCFNSCTLNGCTSPKPFAAVSSSNFFTFGDPNPVSDEKMLPRYRAKSSGKGLPSDLDTRYRTGRLWQACRRSKTENSSNTCCILEALCSRSFLRSCLRIFLDSSALGRGDFTNFLCSSKDWKSLSWKPSHAWTSRSFSDNCRTTSLQMFSKPRRVESRQDRKDLFNISWYCVGIPLSSRIGFQPRLIFLLWYVFFRFDFCSLKFARTARWSEPRSKSSDAWEATKDSDLEHRIKSIRRLAPMELQNVHVSSPRSWWLSSLAITKPKPAQNSANIAPRCPKSSCKLKSPPRMTWRPAR